MKRRSIIILVIIAVIVVIQFFRPSYPEKVTVIHENTLIASMNAPDNVARILETACYDCHSNEYIVPWYGKIAPTSWFVAGHVNEGLEEMNMSDWTSYSRKAMTHKLEEAIEMVNEKEMPLKSYTLMHKDARLSSDQRGELAAWFKEKYNGLVGDNPTSTADEHDHDQDHGHDHDHD